MQLPFHCCVSDQTPRPTALTSWLPRSRLGPPPKGLTSPQPLRYIVTSLTSLARPKQVRLPLTDHTISKLSPPMELFPHTAACTHFRKLRPRHSKSFLTSTWLRASFAHLGHHMVHLCCLSRSGMAPSDSVLTSEVSTRSLRRIGILFC